MFLWSLKAFDCLPKNCIKKEEKRERKQKKKKYGKNLNHIKWNQAKILMQSMSLISFILNAKERNTKRQTKLI